MSSKVIYPVYRPNLNGNEKKYVSDCMDSTWISSKGKYVDLFEEAFSNYIGINHAISVCNGTAALHTALLALGIQNGDEVIVPTLTYIASVNPIKYVGANPVFIDSEKEFWQMDPTKIEEAITSKTKAIMLVHLYGHSCEIDKILKIARRHDLYVIEDCAEAIGTEYNGKKVGTFGDIACFSFFGNKMITTGEGGMVITNNNSLGEQVRKIKGQGLAKGKEYWHDIIGYNFRMTNICAAIGYAQLEGINEIIKEKQKIAQWYDDGLKGLPVEFHKTRNNVKHSYWMCSILVNDPQDRKPLRGYLMENNIETRPLFNPIHLMDMYKGVSGDFPIAENLALKGINLPSYPELKKTDVDYIVNVIKDYYDNKARFLR